jgi:hypothetical protein
VSRDTAAKEERRDTGTTWDDERKRAAAQVLDAIVDGAGGSISRIDAWQEMKRQGYDADKAGTRQAVAMMAKCRSEDGHYILPMSSDPLPSKEEKKEGPVTVIEIGPDQIEVAGPGVAATFATSGEVQIRLSEGLVEVVAVRIS